MGSPHDSVPDWARSWSVVECIECLPIWEDGRTERAMLDAVAARYDGEDARFADGSLAAIWSELDVGIQTALERAQLRYEFGLA